MYLFNILAILAVALLTLSFAQDITPPTTPEAPPSPTTNSSSLAVAIGGALDPSATRPPIEHLDKVKTLDTGMNHLKIHIKNEYGRPLHVSYGHNKGSPPPVGNPSRGIMVSSTQIAVPSGYAGRIIIGKNYDPAGSKIEASYTRPRYLPDIDVSYVDGYTVPISCSCHGVAVSGCNVELFHTGHHCPKPGPGICYNPQQDIPHGPAAPFFAPCKGAAYTYPDDDEANSWGECEGSIIHCCVGKKCPAPKRQPKQLEMRGLGRY